MPLQKELLLIFPATVSAIQHRKEPCIIDWLDAGHGPIERFQGRFQEREATISLKTTRSRHKINTSDVAEKNI